MTYKVTIKCLVYGCTMYIRLNISLFLKCKLGTSEMHISPVLIAFLDELDTCYACIVLL